MTKLTNLTDMKRSREAIIKKKNEHPTSKKDVINRNFYIKCVEVEERTSKTGKPYDVLVIVYSHDGEFSIKKVPVFTDEGRMIVGSIEENACFNVTLKKDGKYWKWVKIMLYSDRNKKEE